jgi:hypothetical protein
MKITKIKWLKMEEEFLIEFANKGQTRLGYSKAVEIYQAYKPVWAWFEKSMDRPGDWFSTTTGTFEVPLG